MSKPNIRTNNKMIAAKFPGYSLIQEYGYVRVQGPDTHTWYSSSVPVCYVSQMSPEKWLETVEEAIKNQSTQGKWHYQ